MHEGTIFRHAPTQTSGHCIMYSQFVAGALAALWNLHASKRAPKADPERQAGQIEQRHRSGALTRRHAIALQVPNVCIGSRHRVSCSAG